MKKFNDVLSLKLQEEFTVVGFLKTTDGCSSVCVIVPVNEDNYVK